MSERRPKIVEDIVRDLVPVRPVRLGVLLVALIVVEIAVLFGMPVAWGWRPDLKAQLADPAFVFVLTVLVCAAGMSAWSALRLSVPGRAVSGLAMTALFAIPLFVASLVVALTPWGGDWPGFGALMDGCWPCIGVSALSAAVPWIVVVVVVARLAPLRALRVGVCAGLSAFLVGAAVAQLHCGSSDAYHLAFGHYLPVTMLSVFTGATVAVFLRMQSPANGARDETSARIS